MVWQNWKYIHWISVRGVVATDWKKLIDKLKQIEAEEMITKENDSQANAGKTVKINVPHHTKGSSSHSTSNWKTEGGKTSRKPERGHCKWAGRKSNLSGNRCYNADLTPDQQKGRRSELSTFV